jgi:hypothetical protein
MLCFVITQILPLTLRLIDFPQEYNQQVDSPSLLLQRERRTEGFHLPGTKWRGMTITDRARLFLKACIVIPLFHSCPLTEIVRVGVTFAAGCTQTDFLYQSSVLSDGSGGCRDLGRLLSTLRLRLTSTILGLNS